LRRNAVTEVLSLKDASRNGVPEHIFLELVELTLPLSDRISGYFLRSGIFLKRKMVPVITNGIDEKCIHNFDLKN
jgi:hypothetical protein